MQHETPYNHTTHLRHDTSTLSHTSITKQNKTEQATVIISKLIFDHEDDIFEATQPPANDRECRAPPNDITFSAHRHIKRVFLFGVVASASARWGEEEESTNEKIHDTQINYHNHNHHYNHNHHNNRHIFVRV